MRPIRSRQVLLGAAVLLVSLSGGGLSASAGAPPGASPALTQHASAGPAQDTAQDTVNVSPDRGGQGPGQELYPRPRVSVDQDVPRPLTLGMANLPAGWEVTFEPAVIQAGQESQMILWIADRAQRGRYVLRITATDAAGQVTEVPYDLRVVDTPESCRWWVPRVADGDFEVGAASPWWATPGVITNAPAQPASSGDYKAWLGHSRARTTMISQTITLPPTCLHYSGEFHLHVDSTEPAGGDERDWLTVLANNTVLKTYSNKDASPGYRHYEGFDLGDLTDTTVQLTFITTQDARRRTNFVIDQVWVSGSCRSLACTGTGSGATNPTQGSAHQVQRPSQRPELAGPASARPVSGHTRQPPQVAVR